MAAAVALLFAALASIDRTVRGAERKRARDDLEASLDATESRAHQVASWAPFLVAIVIAVVFGGGSSDGARFVLSLVAGFLLSQAAFVGWMSARRSRTSARRP